MHIHQDSGHKHEVQSYSNDRIQINSITYYSSVIVSKTEIITDINIDNITQLTKETLDLFLQYKPELIILGHSNPQVHIEPQLRSYVSQIRVGLESMSIGAASRTFNVLLSENRAVVAGFIF